MDQIKGVGRYARRQVGIMFGALIDGGIRLN
jgi:hypothetical protein